MPANHQTVLSVGELTARIKAALEVEFPAVWVEGELSDISRPHSGHCYFTLKDSEAQIRAVMWRSTAARLRFQLEDGMQVICGGQIDVYPPRGSYQLIVRQIEPQGVGALQLALRQLQQRLAAEGLFDPGHKQPLPRFPRRLAFVTSPTGAAVRDFLEALRGRWPGASVLVIPARVQGEGAAEEIARGIRTANYLQPPPDLLIVGRGGGSLEDLWCFNEEAVVRAIHASRIPVISAVGHEIDVTLADLVADARALTPTDAARLAAPSTEELALAVHGLQRRLVAGLRTQAVAARSRLELVRRSRVLARPWDTVHDLSRQIDELESRMARAIRTRQTAAVDRLTGLAAQLESLSPLAVLGRGYSLTERAADGQLVRDASTLRPGDLIRSRLAAGQTLSRVEQVDPN